VSNWFKNRRQRDRATFDKLQLRTNPVLVHLLCFFHLHDVSRANFARED